MRKLSVVEIGKGKFYSWLQEELEYAAKTAFVRGVKCNVFAKITIKPPSKDDCFGEISFSVNSKFPAKESMKFTTEMQNGVIVAEGDNKFDLAQYSLDLELPNIVTINKQTGEIING